jgi:hypothetical protein
MISKFNQPDQVFGEIPNIEKNQTHFKLLSQVYTFVVHENFPGTLPPA